ncbi:MAG TPA: hypothetical protein VN285_08240 [Candidatus Deferrimicrobium sp.]|nr:hypothetical protein [Candidatus Deferrimicrobium sp.]
MLKSLAIRLFAALFIFGIRSAGAAGELPVVDYGILRQRDSLAVWIDLAGCLTSGRLDQLKEGNGLAIEYKVELSRPRRLWGSEQVARKDGFVLIDFRFITEDFFLEAPQLGIADSRHLNSVAGLQDFLADSIIVGLVAWPALDTQKVYAVSIEVTSISLSGLNLAAGGPKGDSGSPLKYLFGQFLRLTGFGRQRFSATSRPFSLSEIASSD